MDRRTAAVQASIGMLGPFPQAWDGEHYQVELEGSFRYFAEEIVGTSVARLMPHLEALDAGADAGLVESPSVRLAVGRKGADVLQVSDCDGRWFGIERSSRPGKENVIEVALTMPDPSDLDYPYPHRVAFATIVDGERPWVRGSCSLGNFGLCLDALKAFAAAAGVDLSPLAPEELSEAQSTMFNNHNEVMACDGGIAGDACREVGAAVSANVARLVMEWADRTMPAVAAALGEEGAAWGRKYLRYNDLDNDVCLLEPGSEGQVSIIHRNSSYISEYRTWVLSRSNGGRLSLYALEDGTDDLRRMLTCLEGKGSFRPVAVLEEGEVSLSDRFDVTGIIGAMAFGLKCDEEVLVGKDRMDSDYDNDFEVFETRRDEGEDETPAPGI